jgi:hypothetical protein
MTDKSGSQEQVTREPTEEEVLQRMHASDRQLYNSPDVPATRKLAVFEFHKKEWKDAHALSDQTEEASRLSELLRIDPRKTDAEYKSFPTFAEWSSATVDVSGWDAHIKSLDAAGEPSPSLLRKARQIVTRAAAIDTGALEHLYEVDKGFTFTVATQTATWEATLDKKGAEVRALIESQMDAYEMVLDFATEKQPVAEVWIRELHAEICKSQKTYSALTEIGWQELPLPLGQYKVSSNHVLGRDGKVHAYAPVDRTPSEMQRLVDELRSDQFSAAHPVLQASYAHYAFVSIHPFADGNGRVARALASVFTYRAESIPLLILSENRDSYIGSLSAADTGNFQAFVNFTFERALDAIRLTEMSLRAASVPLLEDALRSYSKVYLTKGGYTHEQVDYAGYALVDSIANELIKQGDAIGMSTQIQIDINRENRKDYLLTQKETMRHPVVESGRVVSIMLKDKKYPDTSVLIKLGLEVPKDSDLEDEMLLSSQDVPLPFPARITELIPAPSAALQLRVLVFTQTFLSLAVEMLSSRAQKKLREQGFLT